MEVVFISKLCIMKLPFGKLKALLLSSNIYREIQAVSGAVLLLVMEVKNGFLKVWKIETQNWCLAQQLKS